MKSYNDIKCVSPLADVIDDVSIFVGRTIKKSIDNLKRKITNKS